MINKHVESISNVASNRTVYNNRLDKEVTAVRYLNCTKREAYRSFKGNKEIGFTSFCKYMDKIYKKPHRITDICKYCEYGLEVKKRLTALCKEQNYNQEEYDDKEDYKYCLNSKKMLEYFNNLEKTSKTVITIDYIKELFAIQFHRKIAKIQREAYNNMRNDLIQMNDTILIEIDFKQKIVIGSSPRQVSSEYYKHIQKPLLGRKIFYFLPKYNFK